MFRPFRALVALSIGCLGWAGMASAGPLSCVGNVCTTSEEIIGLSTDSYFSNLAKFDSDLGLLTGITITLSGTANLDGEITPKEGVSTARAHGDFGAQLSVTLPANESILIFPAIRVDWDYPDDGPNYRLMGTPFDSEQLVLTPPYLPVFSTSYSSTGEQYIDPMQAVFGEEYYGSLFNADYNPNASVTSKLTIEYTFGGADVPEPATLVLIGSVLVGLGLWNKRRGALSTPPDSGSDRM